MLIIPVNFSFETEQLTLIKKHYQSWDFYEKKDCMPKQKGIS